MSITHVTYLVADRSMMILRKNLIVMILTVNMKPWGSVNDFHNGEGSIRLYLWLFRLSDSTVHTNRHTFGSHQRTWTASRLRTKYENILSLNDETPAHSNALEGLLLQNFRNISYCKLLKIQNVFVQYTQTFCALGFVTNRDRSDQPTVSDQEFCSPFIKATASP